MGSSSANTLHRTAMCLSCSLACAFGFPSVAHGEEPSDHVAEAHALFAEARALLEAKDFAAACPKFEESYKLRPGGGTLLNLAVCNELLGKTATAWADFQEGLKLARRDGRDDREELARQHLATLEPKLSRLRVIVPESSRAPGLVVHRNGTVVEEAAWGQSLPVDPGEQVIEIRAPGKLAARETVLVKPDGETRELVVPPLKDEPTINLISPQGAPPTDAPAAVPMSSEHVAAGRANGADKGSGSGSTQRLWSGIVAGAGVAGLGVTAYLSIRALGLSSYARRDCPNSQNCDPAGIVESQKAGTLADVATGVFAGSAVLVGLGAYFFFTAPSGAVRTDVGATPGGAAVRVSGVF